MTPEDLFTTPPEEPNIDPNKDYLEELVGDNKKFKTPQDLAKGKAYADIQIELQNKRMDQLRAELEATRATANTQAKLTELLDRLESANQQRTSIEPPLEKDAMNQPTYDPKDLDVLLDNKLLDFEKRKREKSNFDGFQAKLKESFGTNYTEVLRKETEALGLPAEEVNRLARQNPTVLVKALGLDAVKQDDSFVTPPRTGQRPDPAASKGPKRTWNYYQELKKSNPKAYFDPKIAVQMHNDAIALGEAFQDGDFNRQW